MSRGWYNPRPYGGPRPPWRPRPMGEAPPRGYWGQGPMFRGYSPRPQWDSNCPPANYQGQYRPQYYQAKRPRYDQFQSYPKRPRYQNNSGNSYDDPFYDKFMLEDPWKELHYNKDPIDTGNGSRCDIEPGVSSEAALSHTSENGSPLQVSVADPLSSEGCRSIAESTSGGLLADREAERQECHLSSACDGSPVIGKPSGMVECSEQMVLEPSNVVESSPTDERFTHSSVVAGSDDLSSAAVDGGAIGEEEAFPSIDGSCGVVSCDGSSSVGSTLPSGQP